MGKVPSLGNRKFMTVKNAFFISPAYEVEPIRIIFLLKLMIMNVLLLVPSISGIAEKSLTESKVNSGVCVSNSLFLGRMNIWLAKIECHTVSVMTLMGSL